MVLVGRRHVPRAGKPAKRSKGDAPRPRRGAACVLLCPPAPSHAPSPTHPTPASANGRLPPRDRPDQSVAAAGLDLVLRAAPGLALTPRAVAAALRLQLRQRPRLAQPPRSGGHAEALTERPWRRAAPTTRRSSCRRELERASESAATRGWVRGRVDAGAADVGGRGAGDRSCRSSTRWRTATPWS